MKRTTKNACLAFWAAAILVQTASAQTGQDPLAAFRFVNRSGADIQVRATGGFEREFLVDDGDAVVQTVPPGAATEIAYWPPWGDGFRETEENPRRMALRAPGAGMTNDVALTLVRQTATAADDSGEPVPVAKAPSGGTAATLRFHNPLDMPVQVETTGGLVDRFEVAPGATEVHVARAGVATICRYHAPYSGLYGTGETNVTGDATVELVLARKATPDALAVLRLSNPNDADVVVALSGGRVDEILVEAGATKEVPVRSGVETTLRYYANDRQDAENSPETAKAGKVTPRGGETVSVDLRLTKRAYPVLQLANGGNVALAVRVAGRREPRSLGAGETRAVPVCVERKFSIEWEAEEDGYLDGSRELGPYEWNKRYVETIVPARRTPPSLRVRNVTPRRGMVVTVSRAADGAVVEEFMLEKGGERTVEFPEAGLYRVRTRARPDKRNDAEQNPASYEATDETVECAWGKPVVLDCTADLKRMPGPGPEPDLEDWLRDALANRLNKAKMYIDEEWIEHGIAGRIEAIYRALQEVGHFARSVDVDGIAGDAVPWSEWSAAVAAKRGVRNAEWQRIVETTEKSGSWKEFFSRYPGQ
ncbi:MAG: hypothetical protein IKQ15_06755 [Kiritimatiellae bacterium]|nr:hypothetical protein [Kiritimatiellia bacterium]